MLFQNLYYGYILIKNYQASFFKIYHMKHLIIIMKILYAFLADDIITIKATHDVPNYTVRGFQFSDRLKKVILNLNLRAYS